MSRDYRLETARGSIRCETQMLACGLWTRDFAAQFDVRVPHYPCEHMYVVAEPLDFIEPGLPVVRDTDGHNYVKEDSGACVTLRAGEVLSSRHEADREGRLQRFGPPAAPGARVHAAIPCAPHAQSEPS